MPHPNTIGRTDKKKSAQSDLMTHLDQKKTNASEKLNEHSRLIVDQFSEK